MHKIIFISTVHKEIGNCSADGLYKIIENVSPEVVFVEAMAETYSDYDKLLFSSFGVFHQKLEIRAVQKYSCNNNVRYVPVLDNAMSDTFEKKYSFLDENAELLKLLDNYNVIASEQGFQFLNSSESVMLQEEMRTIENGLLTDNELNIAAIKDIHAYEDSMIRNIYAYCRNNEFDTAIFLCGVAHRKSIVEKLEKCKAQEEISLTWEVFES